MFTNLFNVILNFVFPPRCAGCGAYVPDKGDWCEACAAGVMAFRRLPVDGDLLKVFDGGVWAVSVYEEPVSGIIKSLKYNKRRSVLPGLHSLMDMVVGPGSFFYSEVFRIYDGMGVIAVPVPLHRERLKERGFNQTELLFKDPLTRAGFAWVEVMVRCKRTAPLFDKKGDERRRAVKGAFALAPGVDVRGRDILLVDDIFTTGATMGECARMLKVAGARHVIGLALASGRAGCGATTVVRDRPPSTPTDNIIMQAYCLIF